MQTLLDYPSSGKYSIIAELFDCAGSRYTVWKRTDYDKDDNQVQQYNNDKPYETFSSTSSLSRQQVLLNIICRLMKPASLEEARREFERHDKEVRKIRAEQ